MGEQNKQSGEVMRSYEVKVRFSIRIQNKLSLFPSLKLKITTAPRHPSSPFAREKLNRSGGIRSQFGFEKAFRIHEIFWIRTISLFRTNSGSVGK